MDNSQLIPAPRSDSEDRVLGLICHLTSLLGVGIVLPLIVYLIKKQEAGQVAAHAKEALNFHLSVMLYVMCAVPLVFIGVGLLLFPAIAIGSLVLAIIAAVKASDGVVYRYPACIRFIS